MAARWKHMSHLCEVGVKICRLFKQLFRPPDLRLGKDSQQSPVVDEGCCTRRLDLESLFVGGFCTADVASLLPCACEQQVPRHAIGDHLECNGEGLVGPFEVSDADAAHCPV